VTGGSHSRVLAEGQGVGLLQDCQLGGRVREGAGAGCAIGVAPSHLQIVPRVTSGLQGTAGIATGLHVWIMTSNDSESTFNTLGSKTAQRYATHRGVVWQAGGEASNRLELVRDSGERSEWLHERPHDSQLGARCNILECVLQGQPARLTAKHCSCTLIPGGHRRYCRCKPCRWPSGRHPAGTPSRHSRRRRRLRSRSATGRPAAGTCTLSNMPQDGTQASLPQLDDQRRGIIECSICSQSHGCNILKP
jgi:hypothetical protein